MKEYKSFTEYLKECKSFEEYLKGTDLKKLKEDIEKLKEDIERFKKGMSATNSYDTKFIEGVTLGTTQVVEAVQYFGKKGDKIAQQEMKYFTLELLTDLTVYGHETKRGIVL